MFESNWKYVTTMNSITNIHNNFKLGVTLDGVN